MPARWVQAKLVKMASERRNAPRSLGVNWHNGRAMKQGSVDLELEGRVAEEVETRKPRAPSIKELKLTFNGLKNYIYFVEGFIRVKIYYPPSRDAFYVVCYNFSLRTVHVSISYRSKDRAEGAWDDGSVRWKYKRKLKTPD